MFESKMALRNFLRSTVNKDRLFSLDEGVGTLSTVTTIGFGVLALAWLEMRAVFGLLSFILLTFFWLSYRIARVLHAIEIRVWLVKSFQWFLPIALSVPFYAIYGYFRGVNEGISFAALLVGTMLSVSGVGSTTRFDVWEWLCKESRSVEVQVNIGRYISEPTYLFVSSWGLIPAVLMAIPLLFTQEPNLLPGYVVILMCLPVLSIHHQSKSYPIKIEKLSKTFGENKIEIEDQWDRRVLYIAIFCIAVYILGIALLHVFIQELEFAFGLLFWPAFLYLIEPPDGFQGLQVMVKDIESN